MKIDIKKHSATIAAALAAIVGVPLTGVLSARAALKAKEIPPAEDKKGKVKRFAYIYGPAILSGVATSGLILTSDRLHFRKEFALGGTASAGIAIGDEYVRFKRKAAMELGDKKVAEIDKEIQEEKQEENLHGNEILVYEPYTDQFIWTTRETIAWAMLQANRKLMTNYDVRLNYIIKMLGGKSKPKGDEIGWNWENEIQDYNWSYFGGPWIDIDLELHSDGPRKCLWLFYRVEPEAQTPENMIYSEGN